MLLAVLFGVRTEGAGVGPGRVGLVLEPALAIGVADTRDSNGSGGAVRSRACARRFEDQRAHFHTSLDQHSPPALTGVGQKTHVLHLPRMA